MELLIRDVEATDAQAIVDLLNPIIATRTHTVFDTPFTVDAERLYIERFPARGVWKVAIRQSDHRLVGFQIMEPFANYTTAFDHVGTLGTYVDLSVRRLGIASRLFASTLDAAIANGYEKVFTFVRADNPAALATYRRHGFEIVGTARKQAKIDARYIDEIMIERSLV